MDKAVKKYFSDRGLDAVVGRGEAEVGRVKASSTWLHLKREPMSREVKGGEQWLPALPALETSFTCTCWLVRNFLHGALFSLRD